MKRAVDHVYCSFVSNLIDAQIQAVAKLNIFSFS